jgi:hypothetical protein
MPINLRPTDWLDAKITSGRIGLIEVPSLNQVQSIRQSGLIVDNCADHQLATDSGTFISVRCYSAEAEELEC